MINRVQQFAGPAPAATLRTDHEDAKSSWAETLKLSQIERFAQEHPIAMITVGLAAGLALGWWVKRK
jgi:ElaB/YqjD/DUF883 family membrane-anchored ribosome-binding protein